MTGVYGEGSHQRRVTRGAKREVHVRIGISFAYNGYPYARSNARERSAALVDNTCERKRHPTGLFGGSKMHPVSSGSPPLVFTI